MSPNLYDLLDVDEAASDDEIREAWKQAIADLDPTDRRFRAYNDAAAVLLDETKRAEYDAGLAAQRAEDDPAEDAPDDEDAEPDAPDDEDGAEDAEDGDSEDGDSEEGAGSRSISWGVIAAAVVAVLCVALLVWVLTWPGSLGGTSPADREDDAQQALDSVEAAAAELVPVVLSYDHRTFAADVDRAEQYLTPRFAEERADLLEQLKPEVEQAKVVVTTEVSGTGVTRVTSDGQRATVVVFVDQASQKGRAEPQPLRMWSTLSLQRDGDDWLLDDLCIQDQCS